MKQGHMDTARGQVTVDSVPVSCTVLTPTETAACVSLNRMQSSPRLLTGYPVLTLPSLNHASSAWSKHHGSPRNSRSKQKSLQTKQLLADRRNRQRRIDQCYQLASCASASMSSHSLSAPSHSSEVQSDFMSPNRKQARPENVPVSPVVYFVKMSAQKDVQPSDNHNVVSRSDVSHQKENCSTDAVKTADDDCIRQPISMDVPWDRDVVNTAQVTEVQEDSFTMAGVDGSNECGRNAVSQQTALGNPELKISLSKLQKLRKIWKKNLTSVYEKSAQMCSLNVDSSNTVSNRPCPSGAVSRDCDTAAHKSADNSSTASQIALDRDVTAVSCTRVDSVGTVSASNELQPNSTGQPSSEGSRMDYSSEDFDESPYAPVESKYFFVLFF